MTGTGKRLTRLAAAALLVLSVLGTASVSAAPTEQEVQSAKSRLEALGHELETVIERWNDARYELQQAQARLAETKEMVREAEAEAAVAREQLEARAVEAYTGMGSQLDVLLEAQDLSEFSDRLQFMGAIAQSDADLATAAEAASQRAEWAREQHAEAVAKAEQHVAEMERERGEIQQMLNEQEALARQLQQDYDDYLEAQRAQAAAAEAAAAAAAAADASATQQATSAAPPPSTDGGGGGGGGGGGFVPPPNASGAQIAVAAARSVLGSPYVWGAGSPGVGFDCSGLTSYAWAQAGVYLPHSASAQYNSLPRVPLSQVQAGDIIYYGNFGPHVALYIGGGAIIHARHPGPGGQVQQASMYGYDKPWGAVRPG